MRIPIVRSDQAQIVDRPIHVLSDKRIDLGGGLEASRRFDGDDVAEMLSSPRVADLIGYQIERRIGESHGAVTGRPQKGQRRFDIVMRRPAGKTAQNAGSGFFGEINTEARSNRIEHGAGQRRKVGPCRGQCANGRGVQQHREPGGRDRLASQSGFESGLQRTEVENRFIDIEQYGVARHSIRSSGACDGSVIVSWQRPGVGQVSGLRLGSTQSGRGK